MIPLFGILLPLLMAFGLLVIIIGGAMLSDSDQHYNYVELGRITQASANDYTEALLETGEAASNSGVFVFGNELKPEFVPNAFGKGKHGASCWDIKQFVYRESVPVEVEAAQVNSQTVGIHTGSVVRTSVPDPDSAGYFWSKRQLAESQTGAAGELLQIAELIRKETMPQDNIDGTSFGYIATQTRYSMFIDGDGNAAVHSFRLGMFARRVILPFEEIFFDRDTIAGLLDAVILESILS